MTASSTHAPEPDVLAGWKADELKAVLLAVGETHRHSLGRARTTIRVAVTGQPIGLPLSESRELLGSEPLHTAVQKLSAAQV